MNLLLFSFQLHPLFTSLRFVNGKPLIPCNKIDIQKGQFILASCVVNIAAATKGEKEVVIIVIIFNILELDSWWG